MDSLKDPGSHVFVCPDEENPRLDIGFVALGLKVCETGDEGQENQVTEDKKIMVWIDFLDEKARRQVCELECNLKANGE